MTAESWSLDVNICGFVAKSRGKVNQGPTELPQQLPGPLLSVLACPGGPAIDFHSLKNEKNKTKNHAYGHTSKHKKTKVGKKHNVITSEDMTKNKDHLLPKGCLWRL